MKLLRIYVAGPMTGLPDLNFPAFHACAATLRAQGHEVVNPAEINPDVTMAWHECMRRDIAELVTCDVIHLLPGWQHSKGATLEHHIAERLGLVISEDRAGNFADLAPPPISISETAQAAGCLSNCDTCTYAWGSPANPGHCYMFYEEPQGVCGKHNGNKDKPYMPMTQDRAEELAHRRCRRYLMIDTVAPYQFDAHTLMDLVSDVEKALRVQA